MRKLATIVIALIPFLSFGATRTWTGAVNTDFNNTGNWSGAGALTGEDLVITTSSNLTISVSASISVGSIDWTHGGTNAVAYFDTGANLVTCTSTTKNTAFRITSGNGNTILYVRTQAAGGGLLVQGNCVLDDGGSKGIVWLRGNLNSPGKLEVHGNLTLGSLSRTDAGYEPNIVFDGSGTQNVYMNSTITFVLGENVTVGVNNTPTVNVIDGSAYEFGVYSGNLTIKAGAILDSDFGFGAMTTAGSLTFGAGAIFRTAGTSVLTGYTANNIDATATVVYDGTVGQTVRVLPTTPNDGYGNLTIAGSGTKTSQADFSIRGNFDNNGTWDDGNDIHTFKGATTTYIGGANPSTFYHVILNKTTGNLNVNKDLDIDYRLILTNGIMVLNANPVQLDMNTVTGNSFDAIQRTNGSIISENENKKVRWYARHTASAHIYPFSFNGDYIPFSYHASAGSTSFVNLSTWNTPANNTTWHSDVSHMYCATIGQDGSDEVVVDRWWSITDESATQTADITFTYRGAENTLSAPYNTGNIGAQRWDMVTNQWDIPRGSAALVGTGTGTLTVTGVSRFSPWVLSALSAPLPLDDIELNARFEGDYVDLRFETEIEIDIEHFTIEKSYDGYAWSEFSQHQPLGNAQNGAIYTDEDRQIESEYIYYRVKSIDKNDKVKYSNWSYVKLEDNADLILFPNPVLNAFALKYKSLSDDIVNVSLYDITGRLVFTDTFNTSRGWVEKNIDVNQLQQGKYILVLTSNDGANKTTSFLKF